MSQNLNYKLLEKEKNKYTFEATIDQESFEEAEKKAFEKLSKNVKIAGFRPGKAPKESIEKKIAGDVFSETMNALLPEFAIKVLTEEKLNPMTHLKYDVKEIKEDGEIIFTFSFHNSLDLNLEDLKKIKVNYDAETVADDEVDMVIRNIIKTSLPKDGEEKEIEESQESTKEEKGQSEDKPVDKEDENFEITDEMVVKLGYEDEKTYEGLKAKVKETLENVKKGQTESDFAVKIIEEAQKYLEFEVPHDIVHEELHRREDSFNARLKQIKVDREAYLKTQGKTFEQLKKDWEEDIKKNVFSDLLAIQVGVKENLIPEEDEMDKEIDSIQNEMTKVQYKGNPQMRDQFRTIMTRNKGMKRLIEIVKENK